MRRQVAFHLRTDTVLFLHGAQPEERAELRATAFKAAARYWFRATLGPFVEVAKLRDWEGKVFGSTEHGTGAAFFVKYAESTDRSSLLPQRPRNGRGADSPSPRPSFKPGRELVVTIRPARPTYDDMLLAAAGSALWLALHLGGIGQRSRRGAGSLNVMRVEGQGLPRVLEGAADLATLVSGLQAGLDAARQGILGLLPTTALGSPTPSSRPPFPMLVPKNLDDTRILVAALAANNESAARVEIMKGLQPYKNAVFGLPYMKPAQRANGQGPEPQISRDRHASPLWAHVHALPRDSFALVATRMRSSSMMVQRWGSHGSWARMDDWLDSLHGTPILVR